VMEKVIDQIEHAVEGVSKKIQGVVTGRVINNLDPLMLGRIQVQLQSIDCLDLSPWCRVATPMAGIAAGAYFIPNPGDEVLVAFEHGDANAPYVVGSLWNAMAPPPMPSPLPQMRVLRTPLGNEIRFLEVPPTIMISIAPLTAQIIMSPAGVQIISGTNVINMTPDGISLATDKNLNLAAGANLTITAPNVTITGASSVGIQSGGTVTAMAPTVSIN
jgi:phage baseplate assembly protein gpV